MALLSLRHFFAMLACTLLLAACGGPERSPYDPGPSSKPMRAAAPATPMPEVAPAPTPATAKEVRIGVLLPLTGDSATLGNALLDAAMLGLFDKYNAMPEHQKPTKVVLVPKDTEGTAKGAALAAKAALDEGAKLFIGPLFAEEVKAAAPLARKAGVSILSFSNNPQVAGNGVHLFGFLPPQQVSRVVSQAYGQDLERVGALVPANEYGELVASALRETSLRANRPLVGIEFYPPGGQDVDPEVQKLLRSGPQGGRPEMDAVLIAEGGDTLHHLVNRLEAFGVNAKTTRLLGTGLWDDPALLANPKLAGGWFAGAPLVSAQTFARRFEEQYGYRAPRLASLAYDAVALAVTLSVMAPDARLPDSLLTNPHGFIGPANGIFRLRPSGLSERGLAVLEITPSGLRELVPAPRAFYEE